jgi:ribosomal protein S6
MTLSSDPLLDIRIFAGYPDCWSNFMNIVMEEKKPRSAPRYWVEKSGKLYARFQYKDEAGNRKEKYRSITDKRTARSTVEKMRREVEKHGAEILESDKMTFLELAGKYEVARLTEAKYANGIKISGRRSIAPLKSPLKSLKEYFGNRNLRAIKAVDIEAYKHKRLQTPVEIEHKIKTKIENPLPGSRKKYYYIREIKTRPRKIASVNRELELLRAMLNFAIENDWLITNSFSKRKGIISKAAEVERERILSFEEEKLLLGLCVDHRKHLKPILICAVDTAMRRGEMFKMQWKNIDFEKCEISSRFCL